MSDEVTTHQIQGTCDGVMLKGEWNEYHVGIGKQYPVKLATKHDDIKALAAAAGTQMAIWTYTEKQGGPNPHRPGEFFKNRYLSNVEVGGTLDPTLAAPSSSQASSGGGSAPSGGGRSDAERISIERQTIVKAAIAVCPTETIKTLDDWFALLTRMDGWIAEGRPTPDAPKPTPTEVATPAAVDPDMDDIPF